MIINFYKKKTSTMRYRNRLVVFKNKYDTGVDYVKTSLSKSGRNISGKQTIYNKKHKIKTKTPVFNFMYPFKSRFFFLKWINLNTKIKKKYNIFETCNNDVFCLPNVFGSTVGTTYKLLNKYIKEFNTLLFGIPCFLKLIPDYFKISNLMDLRKIKPTYAISSGCFSTKIPKKKKDKLLKLILPSKIIKFFKLTNICLIGKNDLAEKKLLKPGKAGYNQNIGFKSIVRGVAMNPVDHPNGGRTKSCKPEKSPWGWIAKLNK